MKYNIAVIEGDGIGPEIVGAGMQVLTAIGQKYNHEFDFHKYAAGGNAIDRYGEPLPKETIDGCLASDSVLLGAVGGPKWDSLSGDMRPEKALLGLRKALGLYTNIRPAKLYKCLKNASPLREEIVERGVDLVIMRELTGGIYFGERGRSEDGKRAYDTEQYSVMEIERIARQAFDLARKRNKRVVSVDKANVLETSRLWRETVHRVRDNQYPDIELSDMLVDNAAMQLVKAPYTFDVVLTNNMFGDILSDEASQLTGSIGLLASASLGDGTRGMYEPIHGSAPDIAGKGIANPIATILSCALMLRVSFELDKEATCIEQAVDNVLEQGYRTADLAKSGEKYLTCSEMAEIIINNL